MTSLILSILIIFLSLPGFSAPIYFDQYHKVSVTNGVLQGGVSSSKELPAEFYGTWSVSSKVIDTNDREMFGDKGSDVWTLAKAGDIITLSNPSSGATASITVKEVKGKTASFTREKIEQDYKEYETATITVDGDNFYGTDTILVKTFRRGRFIKSSAVEYDVEGSKLSGPPIRDIFSDE